jgi:uncharacterized protein YdeI (YjbR/CyaY-like superfamily)
VDDEPQVDPVPDDLVHALREEGALAAFRRFPVGKQNHILRWIDEAAKEATRLKRVRVTVEVALRAREKQDDRTRRLKRNGR